MPRGPGRAVTELGLGFKSLDRAFSLVVKDAHVVFLQQPENENGYHGTVISEL